MKIICKKIDKKILFVTFFISSIVIAGVIHTLDIAVNHTFGITLQSEATYHIKQAVNNQTLQWNSGDTVVLTQGNKISAWLYQANGHFIGVSVPSDGASGGGVGGEGSGSGGGSYTISGVPIWIDGVCVANCDGRTPTITIYQS